MDEYETILKKQYRRIAAEGWIRAALIGLSVGGATAFLIAVAFYLLRVNALWIAAAVGAVAAIVCTAVLYSVRYRPTLKEVAARVDTIGLKERILTMVEAKDDTSYIAWRQREDAKNQLKMLRDVKLKICVSTAAIGIASIAVLASVTATAAAALSFTGVVPPPDEILTPAKPGTVYVEMTYVEGDGGRIEGDLFQIVEKNGDCDEVMAVADDGYLFDIWSDGVSTPLRRDVNVTASATVYATFVKISESAPDEKSDEVMDNVDSDKKPSDMPPAGGAAGKYEEYNQVIDGATYYRDVYREYYEQAMQILDAGGVVPEYIRNIIQEYFDVIV